MLKKVLVSLVSLVGLTLVGGCGIVAVMKARNDAWHGADATCGQNCPRVLAGYACMQSAIMDVDSPTPPTPDNFERCLPDCYKSEQPSAKTAQAGTGCERFDGFVCEKHLRGEWGDPELDVACPGLVSSVAGATLVECSTIPDQPDAPDKWRKLVGFAKQATGSDGVAVMSDSDNWQDGESDQGTWRYVPVTTYTHNGSYKMNRCGEPDIARVACEAGGSATARAINVVHFRLDAATRLKAAGNQAGCQQAALEAVAVSRGLPAFKQAKGGGWVQGLRYKTAQDGMLSEDDLFAKVADMGDKAKALYAACGGAADAPTEAVDEQSFHACW